MASPKPIKDMTDIELKNEHKDVKMLITALERGDKTMSFTAEGQRCYETLQKGEALLTALDEEIARRAIAALHRKLEEIALPQAKRLRVPGSMPIQEEGGSSHELGNLAD